MQGRQLRQHVEISLFQFLAAVMVEQHALGDGGKKGARFARGDGVFAVEQAHEGVLRHIGRACRAAQLLAQPALQPAVVVGIQCRDVLAL
ncbi:hypothetical protein D3C71_403190 [compost metagenome]